MNKKNINSSINLLALFVGIIFILFIGANLVYWTHNPFYVTANFIIYSLKLIFMACFCAIYYRLYFKRRVNLNDPMKKFILVQFISWFVDLCGSTIDLCYRLYYNRCLYGHCVEYVSHMHIHYYLCNSSYMLFLLLQMYSLIILFLYKVDTKISKIHLKSYFSYIFQFIFIIILYRLQYQSAGYVHLRESIHISFFIEYINASMDVLLFSMLTILYSITLDKKSHLLLLSLMIIIGSNFSRTAGFISGSSYGYFNIYSLIGYALILRHFFIPPYGKDYSMEFYDAGSLFFAVSCKVSSFAMIIISFFISVNLIISFFHHNDAHIMRLAVSVWVPSIMYVYIVSFYAGKQVSKKIYEWVMGVLNRIESIDVISRKRFLASSNKNSISGSFLLSNNISELKSLYSVIEMVSLIINRSSEAKFKFIISISHDFRSPLSGIFSISKSIYNRIDNPKTRRLQELVTNTSKKILDTTDSILSFCGNEAAQSMKHITKNKLYSIISDVIVIMGPLAFENGLIIHSKNQLNQESFQIDQAMFQNIMLSAISIAINLSQNNEVLIKACNASDASVVISIKYYPNAINKVKDIIYESVEGGGSDNLHYDASIALSGIKKMLIKMRGSMNVIISSQGGITFIIKLYSGSVIEDHLLGPVTDCV